MCLVCKLLASWVTIAQTQKNQQNTQRKGPLVLVLSLSSLSQHVGNHQHVNGLIIYLSIEAEHTNDEMGWDETFSARGGGAVRQEIQLMCWLSPRLLCGQYHLDARGDTSFHNERMVHFVVQFLCPFVLANKTAHKKKWRERKILFRPLNSAL